MNLRHQTLLLITVPVLGFLVMIYASLSMMLQRSYQRLEQEDAQRNVQRVEQALANDLDQLQRLTSDWAAWDETYGFAKGENDRYIEDNLKASALRNLDLNFIIVINTAGQIVHGVHYDIPSRRLVAAIPPDLLTHLTAESPLLQFPHLAHYHEGLLPVKDQLILTVVKPILRNDNIGPAAGALLMGRYLNAAVEEDLAQRTQINLTIHPELDALGSTPLQAIVADLLAQVPSLPPSRLDSRPALGDSPSPTQLQIQDQNLLKGYALWSNIYGQPQALLEVSLPRDLHHQGELSRRTLGLALLGACVLFTGAILLLLDRAILQRVIRLSQEVRSIGTTTDLTQRVAVQGEDELSHLTQQVNAMLDDLQVSAEKLQAEQQRAETLLLNILPGPIADELMHSRTSVPQHFDEVSILFADIVEFTQLSRHLSPIQLVELLNRIFSAFDALAEQFGLEKIKTIGDAYMVAAGLPTPRPDHAEALAEMALAMQQATTAFKVMAGEPLRLRIGINTGVVVAGVIGTKKFIYDLWGDAVNVASRMESLGEPGRIQVTASTYQHLKDRYHLEPRGTIQVKGRGSMETYWLRGPRFPSSHPPQNTPPLGTVPARSAGGIQP
jgi:adenylate cyclase